MSTARRTLHRRCTNGMRNGRITPVSGRWVVAVLPPVCNGSLTRKLLDWVARVRTIRPVRCCGMWCYVSRLGAFRRFLYGKAHRALIFGVSGKNYGSPSMPGIQTAATVAVVPGRVETGTKLTQRAYRYIAYHSCSLFSIVFFLVNGEGLCHENGFR